MGRSVKASLSSSAGTWTKQQSGPGSRIALLVDEPRDYRHTATHGGVERRNQIGANSSEAAALWDAFGSLGFTKYWGRLDSLRAPEGLAGHTDRALGGTRSARGSPDVDHVGAAESFSIATVGAA